MDARRRIVLSVALFGAMFVLGVVGFRVLGGAGWTWLDAVYMTVITVATIGYGETHDLSGNPAARVFAVVYILLSLGTIAFAVSSITAFVVEGELKNILGRRRMERDIARLKGHFIVCGSDETARTIIGELRSTRRDFVVVEPARERIDALLALGAFPFVAGDPADDEVLVKAGIERASGILLSLPTDEANLFVTISARGLNPSLRIVSKGNDIRSHAKMSKAGADYVVSPTFIGGMRMVSQMVRPAAVSFLDIMLRERAADALRVEDVPIPAGSALRGRKVGEAGLRDVVQGALLVGLKRAGTGEHEFNPGPETVVREGDALIYIATPDAVQRLKIIASEKS